MSPNVDRPTDRIADDAPGPGVENHRHIDKASGGKDRLAAIAVRCDDVATAHSSLKIGLAHQALNLLVVQDRSLLSQGSLNARAVIALGSQPGEAGRQIYLRAGGFLAALIAGIGHVGDICRAGLLTCLFFANHRAS